MVGWRGDAILIYQDIKRFSIEPIGIIERESPEIDQRYFESRQADGKIVKQGKQGKGT